MLYEVRGGKIYTEGIECSVAHHCNLACSACSHMAPFMEKNTASLESFVRDIEALTTVLHAKELRLLGGEPLLNPRLVDFLKAAKASRIADRIMVTTNGLLLHSQPDEFWENVDRVWLNRYPRRSPPKRVLEDIVAKAKAFGVQLEVEPIEQFRATYVTEPHPKDSVTDMIFRTCRPAHLHHCHAIEAGKLYKCAMPAVLPMFLASMGRRGYDPSVDAFDIHAATELFQELRTFLQTPTALDACRWCLGSVGKTEQHHQLDKATLVNPNLDRRNRRSHLEVKELAKESAKYCARRTLEALTGKPRW